MLWSGLNSMQTINRLRVQTLYTVSLLQNGMSEAQIRNRFSSEVPAGEIKRIMPGVVNGIYVWQVYYKDGTHNHYRFYRFSNGEQVDLVYTLPNS